MMRQIGIAMGIGCLALAGCRAERAVFDEGATIEAPQEVQEAPVMPFPPQPFEPGVVAADSVAEPADTGGAALPGN